MDYKRFIFSSIALFFVSIFLITVVFATPANESQDYKSWYDNARELQYKLEAGISYHDYNQKYVDLYAGLRKLSDQYPKGDRYLIATKIIRAFQGYQQIWGFSNSFFPGKNETPQLKEGREIIAGQKYEELLKKNDPEYYQDINSRVRQLDPLAEKNPKRHWLGSNAQKVLIEDAVKFLDELRSNINK